MLCRCCITAAYSGFVPAWVTIHALFGAVSARPRSGRDASMFGRYTSIKANYLVANPCTTLSGEIASQPNACAGSTYTSLFHGRDVQRHSTSTGSIIPQPSQKLSTDSTCSPLVLFPLQGGMQTAASGFGETRGQINWRWGCRSRTPLTPTRHRLSDG